MNSEPHSATLPASPGIRTRSRDRAGESRSGRTVWRRQIALFVNRLLDVLMSAVLLAVLALPMLAIAVLVKLTSRGPALYKQKL